MKTGRFRAYCIGIPNGRGVLKKLEIREISYEKKH